MFVEVIRPGSMSSIQDLGRHGWRRFGVGVGGAMDCVALRTANLLVGNAPEAAGLEMTLIGPTLRFSANTVIALAGADLQPQVAGETVPNWRPVGVAEGTEIRFRGAVDGCRGYMAVAGGLVRTAGLGSLGSHCLDESGDYAGRPLRAGDRVWIRSAEGAEDHQQDDRSLRAMQGKRWIAAPWFVRPILEVRDNIPRIRVVRGRQFDWFTPESQEHFLNEEFNVTSQSNRVGYRLAGPILKLLTSQQLLSEAVSAGAIQVPPAGHPMVLMADCPVTGGYPKIAHVVAVDLPTLAQLRPGSKLRFREIPIEEARHLYRTREQELTMLRTAIRIRSHSGLFASGGE